MILIWVAIRGTAPRLSRVERQPPRRGIVGCLLLPVCGVDSAGGGGSKESKQPAAANGSLLFHAAHAPNLEKPSVAFLSDVIAIK